MLRRKLVPTIMSHWLDPIPTSMGTALAKYPRQGIIAYLIVLLRSVGMPQKLLPYMLAQIMHETDAGFSTLAGMYNNWSGIRCNNHGHTNGCIDISGGVPWKKRNEFATYATPKNWASDYKRVLSLPPARPIDATSAADFFQRLGRNGYYTAKEAKQYMLAFNVRLREVNKMLEDKDKSLDVALKKQYNNEEFAKKTPAEKVTDLILPGKKKPGKKDDGAKQDNFFKNHPLLTGVALALGGMVVIKAVNS